MNLTRFIKSCMQIAIEIDTTVLLSLSWKITVNLEFVSTKAQPQFHHRFQRGTLQYLKLNALYENDASSVH